ncbi:hypothetical protein MJO29_016437 [Puccinia striiformis f. sp. tritici]|nr:hypothetical protein MJO29_016437 [Puccinia striiformis f. sp. tritici]KAI9600733.1 hypothetical protein H4Q26_000524 [Puccinia striiformis f. sp. tritici PST-130]
MIHKYHPSPSTFLTALQQRQQSLSTHSTQFTNTTFRYRRIDPESTQARSLKIQSPIRYPNKNDVQHRHHP